MDRCPFHRRYTVADGPAAIQPAPSSRFCGRSAGSEPNVDEALMRSCADAAEPSRSSRALSAAPGTAVTLGRDTEGGGRWRAEGPVQVGLGRVAGQAERLAGGALEAERRDRPGLVLRRLQVTGDAHPGDADLADARAGAARACRRGWRRW